MTVKFIWTWLENPQTFANEAQNPILLFLTTCSPNTFFVQLQLHQLKASLKRSSASQTILQIESEMSANIDHFAVVHQAFKNLLTNLSPAQMSNFTQQLRAEPITTTRLVNPTSPPELNQYGLMAPVSGNPVRRDKRAARAKVKEVIAGRRKMRPLNAFMAFRCKFSQP